MKTRYKKAAYLAVTGLLLPGVLSAQGTAGEIHNLQSVLDNLYDEMIPLCSQLIDVGRGLAGFGALWYIASRVWRHLASAEPIDVYPLLRPFALGLAILMFPSVLAVINGVLDPIVRGTGAMVHGSNTSLAHLLKKREDEIKKSPEWQMYSGQGNYAQWYKYMHPESTGTSGNGLFAGIGSEVLFAMAQYKYSITNMIKRWMSTALQIFYEAAALCLNTVRTFYLVVLAVLGPIVFGLAVFDGMQNMLIVWFARYINFFLWLPVTNILGAMLGKIQENMVRMDIGNLQQYGESFFTTTDAAYLIFMIMAVVGHFTVPSVANWIVSVAGENIHLAKSSNVITGMAGAAVRGPVAAAVAMGSTAWNGLTDTSQGSGQPGSKSREGFMHNKLSGK